MQGPGADDLREGPPLTGVDAALLAQDGQRSQGRRAGFENPRALGEVELRHVIRKLVLAPGAFVRLPEVLADQVAVLSSHDPFPSRVL